MEKNAKRKYYFGHCDLFLLANFKLEGRKIKMVKAKVNILLRPSNVSIFFKFSVQIEHNYYVGIATQKLFIKKY